MCDYIGQLVSYIAPAAPATRRPANGDESPLRAEIGFTPQWYRQKLGIDFGQQWHINPEYRRQTVMAMRAELRSRFPCTQIGGIDRSDTPLDLLTGAFGTCAVAAIYGLPIIYTSDNWPQAAPYPLTDRQIDALEPPRLDGNPWFGNLLQQCDWIARHEGRIDGYINWQGVLNNAHRIRGQQLFVDMIERPGRAKHLFQCVCSTMIDAAQQLFARQRATGVDVNFFTVSNCLVNLVSAEQYRNQLLEFDVRFAKTFGHIGIHNCAWKADHYLDSYAAIPCVGYIDMGINSNLCLARSLYPAARRAVMYTPMALADNSLATIYRDLEQVARDYAPCDVVFADIDVGVPDEKVHNVLMQCDKLAAAIAGRSEVSYFE